MKFHCAVQICPKLTCPPIIRHCKKHVLALAQACLAKIAIADLEMVTQLSQQVLAVTVKRALAQTHAWLGYPSQMVTIAAVVSANSHCKVCAARR